VSDEARIRQLEKEMAALQADLKGHVVLCDGRWGVVWKIAAVLGGLIAITEAALVMLIRQA
jgi:hypothetical protein